jgi:hypothetical protein
MGAWNRTGSSSCEALATVGPDDTSSTEPKPQSTGPELGKHDAGSNGLRVDAECGWCGSTDIYVTVDCRNCGGHFGAGVAL